MQVRQELSTGETGASEQIELAFVKIDTWVIIDILFFKDSFINVWSRFHFVFPFFLVVYVVFLKQRRQLGQITGQ